MAPTFRLTFSLFLTGMLATQAQDLVILNEYNAVSSSRTLKDGKEDVFFGAVTGNGGDWFELIVVGDGNANTKVDLRGWTIQIHETDGAVFNPTGSSPDGLQLGEVIKLTDHDFYAAVQAGTILTFTELNTAQGGLDTDLNRLSSFAEQGFGWSNVWIGDPAMVDVAASSGYEYIDGAVDETNSVSIGGDSTQFRILNAADEVIFGAAGEGVAPTSGVGSTEVFKLEADPSTAITANDANYTDGSSSSFGAPNVWSGGASRQSFAAFATGAANSAPTITSSKSTGEIRGFTSPEPFKIRVDDPEEGDTLVVSVTLAGSETLPDWITLTPNADRTADLVFSPPADMEAGPVLLTIEVTDGSLTAEQEFTLNVYADTSAVVVNEFNAVDGENWIGVEDGDGDGAPDTEPGTDTFFGARRGNGGDWLELLVVGDGTAGATVDLRGWTIEIAEPGKAAERIVLSDDAYWAAVQVGTILTFIEDGTRDGGLDTHIHKVDQFATAGFAWSNVWIRDAIYINQAESFLSDDFAINNNDLAILLRDAEGAIVSGPTGEEIGLASSINDRSVFKLRETPSAENGQLVFVTGLDGNYSGDDVSSSFGAPNAWSNDAVQQDLTSFRTVDSGPVFVSSPVRVAQSIYRYAVEAMDADGEGDVTITVEGELPAFLQLSEVDPASGTAVLSSTRELTAADQGRYRLRLKATDAEGSEISQVFDLTVVNPFPSVILNEVNLVGPATYLGDNKFEDAAEDSFLGKQLGNGGDWFELAVVADGEAGSTVDMRGWRIEIDSGATDAFAADDTLVLSQNAYWSAVPVGTLLTFATERVLISPATHFNRTLEGSAVPAMDQRSSLGYVWSHIWIGDTHYVEAPEASQGYAVTGETVTGIVIDHLNTQFRLVGGDGVPVFGPAGEGIAPVVGASEESVIEFEGQLVQGISPYWRSEDPLPEGGEGPGYAEGYDEGGTTFGSTFGQPNAWRNGTLTQYFDARVPTDALGAPVYPLDGVDPVIPDWRTTVEVPVAYDEWIAGFAGLMEAERLPSADPEGDGVPNAVELVMGGSPVEVDAAALFGVAVNAEGQTTVRYTRLDPAVEGLSLVVEWSASLEAGSWQEASELWLSIDSNPVAQEPAVLLEEAIIDPAKAGEGDRVFLRFIAQP